MAKYCHISGSGRLYDAAKAARSDVCAGASRQSQHQTTRGQRYMPPTRDAARRNNADAWFFTQRVPRTGNMRENGALLELSHSSLSSAPAANYLSILLNASRARLSAYWAAGAHLHPWRLCHLPPPSQGPYLHIPACHSPPRLLLPSWFATKWHLSHTCFIVVWTMFLLPINGSCVARAALLPVRHTAPFAFRAAASLSYF